MAYEPQEMNTTYEALADYLIANPGATNKECAAVLKRTPAWVSYVINSDMFKSHLAKRKGVLIDPVIALEAEEKLKGLVSRSADIVMEHLEANNNGKFALDTMKVASKALGYGARQEGPVQNNFVVALPGKAASPEEWLKGQGVVDAD